MSRETAYNKAKAWDRAERQARAKQATRSMSKSVSSSPSLFATFSTSSPSSWSLSTQPVTRSLQQTPTIVENRYPFKYKSFNDRLAAVHISASTALTSGRRSTLSGLDVQGSAPIQPMGIGVGDVDDEETRAALLQASTAFGSALNAWRELNLTLPFQEVLRRVQNKSLSLPLILHHRASIADALCAALATKAPDSHLAYEPVLDLLPRLALDLGSEFLPVYHNALCAILKTTTLTKTATAGDEQAAARLVEKAFESIAALFRNVAPLLLKGGYSPEGRTDLLQETWSIVRPYMGWRDADVGQPASPNQPAKEARCENKQSEGENGSRADVFEQSHIPLHVRRFASEAFAQILRRSKPAHLQKAAVFMLQDVQSMLSQHNSRGLAVGVARVWSEVIKSVDCRLHSQAVQQLSSLLLQVGEDVSPARLLVGRLLITALVHHGKACHLVPMYELLIQWARQRRPSAGDALSWLSAAVGTRKGTRIDDSVKPALFELLSRLHHDHICDAQTLTLLSLSIPVGRIPDLVGPGSRVIDGLRGSDGVVTPEFSTLALALGSPEIAWSGFRQFVLPQVLVATSNSLRKSDVEYRRSALQLLSQLHGHGLLDSLRPTHEEASPKVVRWRSTIAAALQDEMETLAHSCVGDFSEEAFECIIPALELTAYAADTTSAHPIASSLRACIASGRRNPSLLAVTSAALAELVEATASHKVTLCDDVCSVSLFCQVVESFGEHRAALSSVLRLYKVARGAGSAQTLPPASQIAPKFWYALMHEDEELRRTATGWLALCAESEAEAHADLFRQMDNLENTPLCADTARDRNVRLRALGRDLQRFEPADAGFNTVNTVCRYMIGTFKVNLSPLWSESRKALIELASNYGDEISKISIDELTQNRRNASAPKDNFNAEEEALNPDFEHSQTDAAFSDPQRSLRERNVHRCWRVANRDSKESARSKLSRLQTFNCRLDVGNYQAQILLLYSDLPSLVERRNRPFMEHFFGLIEKWNGETEDEESDEEGGMSCLTVRERLKRLTIYLRAFAKFSNPKALYRSSEFLAFLHRLLALGEVKIQRLALDCILTWKDPALTTYEDNLKSLLDQSKFRDQLISFDLSTGAKAIQPEHRKTLMPVVIRLLYGMATARKMSANPAGRRVSILNAIGGCSPQELGIWTELMLSAFNDQRPAFSDGSGVMEVSVITPKAYPQQQSGFLGLLADCLKHIGTQLKPFWPLLIGVTVNIAHHNALKAAQQGPGRSSAQSRDIRQMAIRRIGDFFRNPSSEDFDKWSLFTPVIFEHLVSPRLPTFAAENTQSPSALLELFNVWSLRVKTMPLLVTGNPTLLPAVYKTLAVPSVKKPVISVVLDIVDRLVKTSEPKEDRVMSDDEAVVQSQVFEPFIPKLIEGLAPLMEQTSTQTQPDGMLGRGIQTLAGIAAFVKRSEDATKVLDLLGPMMRKSNRLVPEKNKAALLAIFRDLLLLTDTFTDPKSDLFDCYYSLFASMWSRLRSRNARLNLGSVFKQIALIDPSLAQVADWVEALNSYSEKRLDEPNFDRRIDVFDQLSEEPITGKLTLREWQPLVHNMLFFITDAEELVLRSNASAVLKRFVDVTSAEKNEDLKVLLTRTAWPTLRKFLRSRSELVRKAVLSVLDTAVKLLPGDFVEMHDLLAAGDEEANFFNNIHHVQAHRRIRALRRLGEHAETGALRSKTISEVFVPLVGHALECGHTSLDDDHNLMNETIACLGRLAKYMQWGSYNALLWKYLRLADAKTSREKIFIRAVLSVLDNFHFAMDAKTQEEEISGIDSKGHDEDDDETDAPESHTVAAVTYEPQHDEARVVNSVTGKLLPALMGYLEHHDDATDDAIRLPIAVGVVRVVECLPAAEKELHLAKLLNVLASVFRSKSQETRDLARETLCKAAVALGPSRLPQIVHEQKRALTRGPQLAVLAYNVHSVLVHLMQQQNDPLDLIDHGVEDLVAIASEDLFGHTSEDREAIEHKYKIREQKQSKSLDTFELVAKIVEPRRIGALLFPLKGVLERTEVPRAVKAVEDALRRIASGINSNSRFDYATLLGLCHDLISRNASLLKPRKGDAHGRQQRTDSNSVSQRDHYAANAYRFVAFGLDLLLTAMRRSRFEFGDSDVLARLNPLLADVGNTLYASDGSIVTLGLRTAGALLRCSALPSLSTALPVLIRQTTSIIAREASAASDTSQAGLRVLTIMLRDCPQAEFKEKQLADILDLILPDIEEPNVQSVIFGFIRAIIGRRFVIPEIYDVMDKIAEMMVTNQSSQVREISRATFLQFLLDYPQGRGRLRNQIEFLAKNLAYVHESGRLSVMELLTAVFAKFGDDVLAEYSELLFVALVMVLANDDSSQCREKASELIKGLVVVVDKTRQEKFVEMAHAWGERPGLSRVGLQVYGILVDVGAGASISWAFKAGRAVRKILQDCSDELARAEQADGAFDDLEWQLPYQALQVATKLAKVNSTVLIENSRSARKLLLFPHSWVRAASCRFLGSLFATLAPSRPPRDGSIIGIDALLDTARKLSLQLRSETVDDALSLQIIKNLLWIGKSFAEVPAENSLPLLRRDADRNSDNEENSEDGDNEEQERRDGTKDPLAWLFTKLSYQARSGYNDGNFNGPRAILRWFAAMAQNLKPASRVETFLPYIIVPLFRIMDEHVTTRRKAPGAEEDGNESLKTLASEVQDFIQEKVGTTTYAAIYSSVRSRALEIRRKRKADRLMRGIEDPEGEAKRKRERNEAKHQSRKRKNCEFAQGKGVKTTRVVKRTRN